MIENLILFSRNHQKEWTRSQQEKASIQEGRSQFLQSQMEFYRNLPDPKKTESILKMQFPPDKETMHSFLGLVNFLN